MPIATPEERTRAYKLTFVPVQRLLDAGQFPDALAELERVVAVSPECAEAMATGLRERSGADITLAVTGIAGPEGGTAAKPVGTVHFALAGARGVEIDSRRFGGSRDWIRERAAAHGLWLLWKAARSAGK
jgi:nicotinamide-nucleotide amidase